jgi:hypothetical protein
MVNTFKIPQPPATSGNPRADAIADMNTTTKSQSNLIKAVSGGKRRRINKRKTKKTKKNYKQKRHTKRRLRKRGGGVVVPQYTLQYKAQGTNPNDILVNNTKTSIKMQNDASGDKF